MGDEPHYTGHRQRLRDRFLKAGDDGLQDYELLELVLFRGIPRRDVKPHAKKLIEQFGSFAEVVSAPVERLREAEGLGDAAVTELKIVQAAALKLSQARVLNRPVLRSWAKVMEYCTASIAYGDTEQFRVLFLDHKHMLVADEVQAKGTVNDTPVYPREVVKRALDLGASGIVLAHNHPSGDPTPSRADIDMTREIEAAGRGLKVQLIDHLVIGRGAHVSFREAGLI